MFWENELYVCISKTIKINQYTTDMHKHMRVNYSKKNNIDSRIVISEDGERSDFCSIFT